MGACVGIRANLELPGELPAGSSAGKLGELGCRARSRLTWGSIPAGSVVVQPGGTGRNFLEMNILDFLLRNRPIFTIKK